MARSRDCEYLRRTDGNAGPFDPVEHHARSAIDPAVGVEDRPIGQLGIALAVDMSDRVRYVREDGWNRVLLALRRQAS
ncbi:MAG: hypothetical protein ACXWUL_01510 [Caldimonas sp.]